MTVKYVKLSDISSPSGGIPEIVTSRQSSSLYSSPFSLALTMRRPPLHAAGAPLCLRQRLRRSNP